MTGEIRDFTVDGMRIGVDPASMRIVESNVLPPDTAVFVADDGRVRDFLKPVKIEVTAKLDPAAFGALFRTLHQGFDNAARALRSLHVAFRRPPALRRPRSPGPADAATRRIYTAQRHAYRRALRRRRRQPTFSNHERFAEIYAPAVVTRQLSNGSLEAQLMAYQPKG